MSNTIPQSNAFRRLGAALAGLLVALVLACAFAVGVASPAQAADVDPQTQAALQELEQAFTEAYEASQDAGSTADEASGLRDSANGAAGEAIADDETPLAAYPDDDASAEADAAAAADEEEILDDENPLAASPYAASVNDFVWVLLAVIIAVAVFFFMSNRRLGKNIDQMRRFVD